MKFNPNFLFLAAMALPVAASAADIEFTYPEPGNKYETFGTGVAERYDVGILIPGEFAGGVVRQISAPVFESEYLTDFQVWTSTELGAEFNGLVADVTPVDGMLRYSTTTDVTIPAGGLYVGYSFTVQRVVDDISAEPVLTLPGMADGAFYVKTGTKYRQWTSMSAQRRQSLPIVVTIDADVPAADMAVAFDCEEINVDASAQEFTLPLSFTNFGAADVKTVTLELDADGNTMSQEVDCSALAFYYGKNVGCKVVLPNVFTAGEHNLVVKVASVNSVANVYAGEAASMDVFCYTRKPVNRPILEEYTGLWCNYCPVGYAALEYMNRVHPEDFIGVAFHENDKMSVIESSEFPSYVPSYPYGYLNRNWVVDPYHGRFDVDGNIETDWEEMRSQFTPVEISVEATADQADPSKIEARASVNFVRKPRSEQRLFYYLLADGLQDPSWKQANAYSGYDPADFEFPEMEVFCNSGIRVEGLVFNDIVVMLSDPKGIAGSLPAEMEADTDYTHDFSFNTAGAVSLKGVDLIGMATKLQVVAGVVDMATGRVINCAKTEVSGFGGIGDIEADGQVLSVEYFDIYGRRASVATEGLLIEVSRRADGSTMSRKVYRRL
ncbi:MAG: hypothetical protein K2M00_07130 [Muribaculaceae bacterium]|nr:hypothetical protein [Muribaculaceae bacterium]